MGFFLSFWTVACGVSVVGGIYTGIWAWLCKAQVDLEIWMGKGKQRLNASWMCRHVRRKSYTKLVENLEEREWKDFGDGSDRSTSGMILA